MPEEWIVQVEGREYGPVELQILREWKEEGRVLPTNQARQAGVDIWIRASQIPGLFDPVAEPGDASVAPPAQPGSSRKILRETFRIYGRGFFQFFGLALLVIVPSLCAQLTDTALETSQTMDTDLRSLLQVGFEFCMGFLFLALWPIYLSGIQILTAELEAGRPIGFFSVLSEAVKLWPRIAVLCILVYGAFSLLMLLAIGIVVMIVVGASSLFVIILALGLLVFQVWMFGRLFVNVLFWQQFAVLGREDVVGALRKSKALARGRPDLVWYQRPLWRGVFISSLWFAFVLVLDIPMIWPSLQIYFDGLITAQDPQAMMQAVAASSKAHGANMSSLALGLFQTTLRPLLGIAFVLLYFDAKSSNVDEGGGDGRPSEL
jgi:hypothetical protein